MGRIRPIGALIVSLTLTLCLAAAGCGVSGGPSAAVNLTKWLSPDAPGYDVVDLATLREDLDQPEDADPFGPDLAPLTNSMLGGVGSVNGTRVGAALNLRLATAVATTKEREPITVIATGADTGDVGSALGDLGFRDRGGVLTRDVVSPALRLDDGLIYFADDPALLRGLPDKPADDLPAELLGALDAPVFEVATVDNSDSCVRELAFTAAADGSGELAFLIDGGAESGGLAPQSAHGFTFGETSVDGDLITVSVSSDAPGFAARDAGMGLLTSYDCG